MQENQKAVDIYEIILHRILILEYKPGDVIDEKSIAEELNVSRTPVREALLKLSNKSFIKMIPRIGTYVSQVDIKEIKNAYQIKKKMEAFAAELAAENASDEEIKRLLEIAEEMDTYNGSCDYEKYIDSDYEFFKIIRELSRNESMIVILEDLNNIIKRFLRYIQYVCESPKWHVQSLATIARDIKNKDVETAYQDTEYFNSVYVKKLFNTYFT